jgi:hypothetical protein
MHYYEAVIGSVTRILFLTDNDATSLALSLSPPHYEIVTIYPSP